MGLRHLIVVNNSHEPVGIVTRKDIMYSKLHKHYLENVSIKINLGVHMSKNTYHHQKQALETATAESMAPYSSIATNNIDSPTVTKDVDGTVLASGRSPFGVLQSNSNDDEGTTPLTVAGQSHSSGTSIELKGKAPKKRNDHDYINDDNV